MRGATRRRSHLIADRHLQLYCRRPTAAALAALAVAMAVGVADAIRCYAGDPVYQHECTSLSYCLLIISRSGRSQWSCDGNSFNQISLCSNLGLMEDILTGSASSGGAGGGDRDVGPLSGSAQSSSVIFEAPGVISIDGGRRGESTLDDETLAEYYRRQEDSIRDSFAIHEAVSSGAADGREEDGGQPPKMLFASGKKKNDVSAGSAGRETRAAGRSWTPPASIRYYASQRRCFDGGDLGRICCCSSDFCNGAATVVVPAFMVVLASAVLIGHLRFFIA